jgi:hypothetical protein
MVGEVAEVININIYVAEIFQWLGGIIAMIDVVACGTLTVVIES